MFDAQNHAQVIKCIDSLIKNEAILLDAGDRNVFENTFLGLAYYNLSAEEIYQNILRDIFNSPAVKALQLRSLKEMVAK